MKKHDIGFLEYKSRLRGSRSLKSSFDATLWGIENISPFSYRKAIRFLKLYPKASSSIFRTYSKDTKELVKYLPPISSNQDKNILWYINALQVHAVKLSSFMQYFMLLDSSIERGQYQSAKNTVNYIRETFGESLVLQNREIRILRETLDIKLFTQEIDRKIESYGHCVGSIILRMSGRVYGDEFSYRSYEKDCNKFINKVTPTELKPFLSYWLLNQKVDREDINKVLAVSASSSIYDLFFVFFDLVDSARYLNVYKTNSTIGKIYVNYFTNFLNDLEFDAASVESYLDDIIYYGGSSLDINNLDSKNNIRTNLSSHINQVFLRAFSGKFNPLGKCFEINFLRYSKKFGEVTVGFTESVNNLSYLLINSGIDIDSMEYLGSLTGKANFYTEKSLHALAVMLLKQDNFVMALEALNQYNRKVDIVKDILVCEIYRKQNNLEDLIRVCSTLIVESLEYSYILPLSEAFGERWKGLSKLQDKLSLTICLFASYLSTPSRTTLRNMRYSWQDTLKEFGVQMPSEIKMTDNDFINKRIIFFLRYTCSVEVMETYKTFEKTRDIEDELRSIYAYLIYSDPNNQEEYQQKILFITTKHKIEDAIKKMDRSRIFVDLGMLVSWAENNITDVIRRFRIVASREYKEIDGIFENTIKTGNYNTEDSPIIVYVSSRESNLILSEIIEDIRDNYLNNIDYGLDAYLSMRIRHGSFSGQIRSPLQNNKMIAYLSEDSVYYYSSPWETEEINAQETVEEKIIDFSRTFDLLIDDFVKNRLRIKSEDKPNGFFDISLNDINVKEIKRLALEDAPVANFILHVSSIFKEEIKKCLLNARIYLEEILKPKITEHLYELRLSIDSIIDKKYADSFITNYESTIKELNTAFTRVIEWFDFDAEFENNSDLSFREYVDLFIESAHYAHVDFRMRTNIDINFDHNFDDMTIYRLNDIIFTLVDNMYKYSGSINPYVNILFRMAKDNILNLKFTSQLSESIDKAQIISRTEEILNKIFSGEKLPHTKSEGRSGLIKIANTARLSGGDIIFAGLNDNFSEYIVDLDIGVKCEGINC